MFDFSKGYPTPEAKPTVSPLLPTENQDIQIRGFGDSLFGNMMQGLVGGDYATVPSINPLKMFNGQFYSRDEEYKIKSDEEYNNLKTFDNMMNGSSHDPAVAMGWAKDPSRRIIWSQLMGGPGIGEMPYGQSELTPEALAADQKYLDQLSKSQPEGFDINSIPADKMTEEQRQIKMLKDKLTYAQALGNTDNKTGFSWWNRVEASDPSTFWWHGFQTFGDKNAELNDNDIARVLTRKDPNFDPNEYWTNLTADSKFATVLLEHGITSDFIEKAPNKDYANFRITSELTRSEVQRRLNKYTPSRSNWWKETFLAEPAGFMVESPTGAALLDGAAKMLGVAAVAASAEALIPAFGVGAATAEGAAATAETVASSSNILKSALSLYELPLGMAPEFLQGSTYLTKLPMMFGAGFVAGGLGSLQGQRSEIAFANATMYANPHMRTDISYGDAALEGFYMGLQNALVFGVGFGLAGDLAGAYKNRVMGTLVDSEKGVRNAFDKRFTFEGTKLGNTIEFFQKDKSIIDMSPSERVAVDAVKENKEITPAALVAETEGRVDRVETREALRSAEHAQASPEDPGTRRYENEPLDHYINRTAPNRAVRNIHELVTAVAQRTPEEGGARRTLASADTFDSMSTQDKIRTLLRTKDVIAKAQKAEEETVGLPAERERVYEGLEAQRKTWVNNLSRTLSKSEFKRLKEEINGKRKHPQDNLPELLKVAKDKTAKLADRKEAASEAANHILEASRSAATSPERAKVVKMAAPKEVIDAIEAAAMEHNLTGTVSEKTADMIKKSVMSEGSVGFEDTSIGQEITKSIRSNRLNPERVQKIKAIQENPDSFLKIAQGSEENVRNYFNFVNDLRDRGIIGDREKNLLLASVVHMNFDKRGFNIKYEISPVEIGIGEYDANTRTLKLSDKFESSRLAALTVLHELGHAFFAENASGDVYLNTLRLFNNTTKLGIKLLDPNVELSDPLLDIRFLKGYHFQNGEEMFVQSFSQILLLETQEALKVMKPVDVSMIRSSFKAIKNVILSVTHAFDNSEYYGAAGRIITELTTMDENLKKNAISVPKMSLLMSRGLEFTQGYTEFNDFFQRGLEQINPEQAKNVRKLTKREYEFISKTGDPTLINAAAIIKSTGKDVIDSKGKWSPKLVEAYGEYKQSQFNSMLMKLAYVVHSGSYEEMVGMDKKARRSFIINDLFKISSEKSFLDGSGEMDFLVTPAMYEDRLVRGRATDTGATYNKGFMLTTADSLLNENIPDEMRSAILENPMLTKSLYENIKDHLNLYGLDELSDYITEAAHEDFVARVASEGLLNIGSLKNVGPIRETAKKNEMLKIMGTLSTDAKSLKKFTSENLFRTFFDLDDTYASILIKRLDAGEVTKEQALGIVAQDVASGTLKWDGNSWAINAKEVTPVEQALPSNEALAGDTRVTEENFGVMLDAAASKAVEQAPNLAEAINTKFVRLSSNKKTRALFIERQINGDRPITKEGLVGYLIASAKGEEKNINRKGDAGVIQRRAANGLESAAVEDLPSTRKQLAPDVVESRFNTDNLVTFMSDANKQFKQATNIDILSPEEQELINKLNEQRTILHKDGTERVDEVSMEELAKALNVNKSTVSRNLNKIKTKFFKYFDIDLSDPKLDRNDLLGKFTLKFEKVLNEKKPEPIKVKKTKLPAVEKVKDAAKAMVKAEQIKNEMADSTPPPVDVLTNGPTEGHAIVETETVKPAEQTPVVHPEKVADSLVKSKDVMSKTAVTVSTKKTFSMKGIFTRPEDAFDRIFAVLEIETPDDVKELDTEAKQRQHVVDLLKSKGFDSIMDERGNIIPLVKPEVKGTVKRNKKSGMKPSDVSKEVKEETTISTEDGKTPVLATETKEVDVKGPVGSVEAKDASPEVVQPVVKAESEVAKIPESEALERKVNENPELLRNNGMDRNFLRLFSKHYWESKVEANALKAMTAKFKQAWSDFTLINKYIADANMRIFGEDVMERFWAKVDELKAEAARTKAMEGPKGNKALSMSQILTEAAKAMNEEDKPEFVRPMLPSEVKFVKADAEGNIQVSGKGAKNKAIIEAAMKDAERVEPPVVEPKLDAEGKPVPEETQSLNDLEKEPEEAEPTDTDKILAEGITQSEAGASRLLRLNNLVGFIFGGADPNSASWWRKMMSKAADGTQNTSKLGKTIRNFNDKIAFVSRWADDSRAQTGHLVAAGTKSFKTMLQCKMEEGMMTTRMLRAWSMLDKSLNRTANRAAVNDYIYDCLYKGVDPNKADLARFGVSPAAAEDVLRQSMYVVKLSRSINQRMLYMEMTTGRMISVDSAGAPLDPNKYAPVQLDHERLARLAPTDEPKLLEAMVKVRTARKLADPRLDENTMIAMGWKRVSFNQETQSYEFFDKGRVLRYSEGTNMFSTDTLTKLRMGENGKLLPMISKQDIVGGKNIVKQALNKLDPKKYFALETDDSYIVYRMPTMVDDLAPADAAKYREALLGNTAMYTEEARSWLRGKNLIEKEMAEMLAYKRKEFPYNQENYGLTRPMFKLSPDGKVGITVPGLTPEEVMSDPLLKSVIRTNLAEAYYYWLKGRYFDLSFQSELDRVLGTKGITWDMVLRHVGESASRDINTMAKAEGSTWTAKQKAKALQDIAEGIERLGQEFRAGTETLPFFNSKGPLAVRAVTGIMKTKMGLGYGVSQFAELMAELAKETPEFYRIPQNVFTALRMVAGDMRFSKNKILMSDLGDMTFALENFKTDLSNRFLGEEGHGTLSTDSPAKSGLARMKMRFQDSHGFGETLISGIEALSDVSQALGSLHAQTQATRVIGKLRIQREMWRYINKGALERLITNLEKPEVAAELAALKKEAGTNQNVQPKLWKKFAGIARESGFGFDQHDALLFMKYGFTDAPTVKALKWALEKAKAGEKDGRVSLHDLWDMVDEARRTGAEGVDPDVLERAVSNYQFMIEDKITKEVTSEGRGLNRQLDLESRSSFGKLWYALTSFTKSYQDNVIMGYGSKSTIKYLAGGVFLAVACEGIIALLKEWMAGRQGEDIRKELQDHPSEFAIRGASRVPFLGVYNGFLEAGLAGASYMNGGTYNLPSVPFLPPGATMPMNQASQMYGDAKKIYTEPDMGRKIKAASNLLGFTDVINRSDAAIPIRTLEDMGVIERQSAFGTLLDQVHRRPYPYMSQANQQPMSGGTQINGTEAPRNYAMENEEYIRSLEGYKAPPQQGVLKPNGTATRRGKKRSTMYYHYPTSPNEGVSGILGDLLSNDQ